MRTTHASPSGTFLSWEAFFSRAFRPFFFGAGLMGGLMLLFWLLVLAGAAEPPTHFAPRDWHVHEMLFGYFAAAMTGFLLTAVPNWTGRMPLSGTPLMLLFLLWLAGRMAIFFSAIAPVPAILVDAAYLPLLAFLVWREIIAGNNRRNIVVAALVSALALANLLYHAEYLFGWPTSMLAERLALSVAAGLIMLIGGRIVPSFTRNWLMKQGVRDEPRLPAPFSAFDRVSVLATALALASWLALPEHMLTGTLFALAGALHLVRLYRWRGWTAARESLVWILHVGYLWVPAWMLLMAAALLAHTLPVTDALHALTAGAIVTMTLAVMTRASRGHSGLPLAADRLTTAIYLLAIAGGIVRILAAVLPPLPAWHTAGALTATALLLFALSYVPVFFRPRTR